MGAGVDVEADHAIMAFIRELRKAHELPRVGAFALLFTDATRLRFLNYAIPDDGADPDDAEVEALVEAFEMAERLPRVEFLPSVAPALESRLAAHGWTVEDRLPLMTCTMRTVRDLPAPDGVVIELPSDDATLFEMASLQHDIFEDPEPADERSVARLRGSLSRGGRALIARDAGSRTMVGAAQSGAPGRRGNGDCRSRRVAIPSPQGRRRRDGLGARGSGARSRTCNGLPRGGSRRRRRLPKRGIPADIDQRAHIVWA